MKKIIKSCLDNFEFTKGLYTKLRYYNAKSKANIPDEEYAINYYNKKFGRRLNLKNPETFDEKIWWLKIHYHNDLLTQCADKLLVRDYVESCGLGYILNDLYAVYDKVEDIDIDNLPDKFYLKCNHVSGGNVACVDKEVFDLKNAKKKLNWYMGINQYYITREWQYKNIMPRILAEKYLENEDKSPLVDYKFYCFNGEPKILLINFGTTKLDGSHQDEKYAYENYYDINLRPLLIIDDSKMMDEDKVKFPKNFDEMLKQAIVLSKPFPFVRVDFYEINNEIKFGELTFTCAGGCHNYKPEKYHKIFGSYLDLSKI